MIRKGHIRSVFLAWVSLGLLAEPAAALTADVTPSNSTLSPGRTSPTYALRWLINASIAPATSTEGTFFALPSDTPIGVNPVPVTDPNPAPPLMSFAVERLRIPQAVIRRAQDLGSTGIAYERLFDDGDPGATDTARFVVSFTGGLGGPFAITRFELRFDDDSPLRVAHQRETFRAIARVNYSGAGVIQAVWEIAGPALSRNGDAVIPFRQLRRVRQRFDGSGLARLSSPVLPTRVNGLHVVRLRFEEPDESFEPPDIRYFVLEDEPGTAQGTPEPIDVTSPHALASVGEGTRFAWAPMEGVSAYRLVFYGRADQPLPSARPDQALESTTERAERIRDDELGPLVAGAMIPGDKTEHTLTQAVRGRLRPGARYAWRVQAIAADGSLRGQSALRDLRVPAATAKP